MIALVTPLPEPKPHLFVPLQLYRVRRERLPKPNPYLFVPPLVIENDSSELFALILGIVDGGLHGLSWNAHFPSPIESTLWRISCFGVVPFTGITVGFVRLLDKSMPDVIASEVWRTRFMELDSTVGHVPVI